MQKGAQIDYERYAVAMRQALSGPQICNDDGSLNHIYFNTKKGFYWSEENNNMLAEGLNKHGLDWIKIKTETFNNLKSEVEIELRTCILLGVKQTKNIGEKQLAQFKKTYKPKTKAVKNGKKN